MSTKKQLSVLLYVLVGGITLVSAAGVVSVLLIRNQIQHLARETSPVQVRIAKLQQDFEHLSGLFARISAASTFEELAEIDGEFQSATLDVEGSATALERMTGDEQESKVVKQIVAIGKQLRAMATHRLESRQHTTDASRKVSAEIAAIVKATEIFSVSMQELDKGAQVELRDARKTVVERNNRIKAMLEVRAKLEELRAVVYEVQGIDRKFRLNPLRDKAHGVLESLSEQNLADDALQKQLRTAMAEFTPAFAGDSGLLAARQNEFANPQDPKARRAFLDRQKGLLSVVDSLRNKIAEGIDPLELEVTQASMAMDQAIDLIKAVSAASEQAAEASSAARTLQSLVWQMLNAPDPDAVKGVVKQILEQCNQARKSVPAVAAVLTRIGRASMAGRLGPVDRSFAEAAVMLTGPGGMSETVLRELEQQQEAKNLFSGATTSIRAVAKAGSLKVRRAGTAQENALTSIGHLSNTTVWLVVCVASWALGAGLVVGRRIRAGILKSEALISEKLIEVRQRNETIRTQQRDMRAILHNLQQGLVTINLDGQIRGETSSAFDSWFGAPAAENKLSDWVGEKDSAFGQWLELGLESVREAALPFEVALAQLPSRVQNREKTFSVQYQVMSSVDEAAETGNSSSAATKMEAAEKLLVIFTDISDVLRRERAEQSQKDLLSVFHHLILDKSGFLQFLDEAEEAVRLLEGGGYENLDHLKRLLHTLKGNSAIFGMRNVSEACHALENQVAEQSEAPCPTEMTSLFEAWRQMRSDIDRLMGQDRDKNIEIDHCEYNTVLDALKASVDVGTLSRMIESWRFEPTEKRLVRVEQQLRGIAERMGKTNIAVSIEPNDLRFDSERFAPFWSAFIHALRNTVDHGVENLEERQKKGKPDQSSIKISTAIEGDRFVITIEDDGPGIDWERLQAKAVELGLTDDLPPRSAELLCLPGLSSKESVTQLSGRGVGMAALADACQSLGGTLEVESERGLGTRIRFVFPKDQSIYEGHVAVLKSNAAFTTAYIE